MVVPSRVAPGLAFAIFASSLALAGCKGEPEAPPPKPAASVTITPPSLPLPPPPLGRAELLVALDAAASAYAAGAPGPSEDVAGRRFTIRQAFGCPSATPAGEGGEDGRPSVVQDANRGTLELSLRPADWTQAPVVQAGGAGWEAVEGFWLSWPWMRTDGCPAAPPPVISPAAAAPQTTATQTPAPVIAAASPQTAGLAAVFEHGGSRLTRRDGRALRHVIRGEAPVTPPQGGYRLVLEGRFAAFPDGRAIRCITTAAHVRPVCIAAAEIDRTAFEDAQGGVLSEWRGG